MKTLQQRINEKLKISISQIIGFKELIDLFSKSFKTGIPVECEKIFGSKPIFYAKNEQSINDKIKKCDNKPIDKIGFIEETNYHNACIFFIVDGNDRKAQPIGVQNYDDLLSSIGSEYIIKLKNYLTKNAKH